MNKPEFVIETSFEGYTGRCYYQCKGKVYSKTRLKQETFWQDIFNGRPGQLCLIKSWHPEDQGPIVIESQPEPVFVYGFEYAIDSGD
jgi:hypothetical protein